MGFNTRRQRPLLSRTKDSPTWAWGGDPWCLPRFLPIASCHSPCGSLIRTTSFRRLISHSTNFPTLPNKEEEAGPPTPGGCGTALGEGDSWEGRGAPGEGQSQPRGNSKPQRILQGTAQRSGKRRKENNIQSGLCFLGWPHSNFPRFSVVLEKKAKHPRLLTWWRQNRPARVGC